MPTDNPAGCYFLYVVEGDELHKKKLDLDRGVFYHWIRLPGCDGDKLQNIERGDPKVLAIAGEFWEAEIDQLSKGFYYEC